MTAAKRNTYSTSNDHRRHQSITTPTTAMKVPLLSSSTVRVLHVVLLLVSAAAAVVVLPTVAAFSNNVASPSASAFVATTSIRNNNNNDNNSSFRSRPRSSRGRSMLFVATPSGLTTPAPATQTTQIDDGHNSNHNHQQESDEQSTTDNTAASSSAAAAASKEVNNNNRKKTIDRPLLRDFGKNIDERVLESTKGQNLFDLVDVDHFTSDETIPILDMKSDMKSKSSPSSPSSSSTRREIRKAYTASDTENSYRNNNNNDYDNGEEQEQERGKGWVNGRSSGSGCTIIRLKGKDAVSVKGLADFADQFFVGVDDESRNARINDVGVFRIANNVHAGFDKNVENDGKMQVLYTKIIPGDKSNDDDDSVSDGQANNGDSGRSSMLLPLEVGDLVGTSNLDLAHKGMNTLLDIGSQITSAVLGMDETTINKLLDDCAHGSNDIINEKAPDHSEERVANSYLRVIRYLEPHIEQEDTTAFWPHVDSTFLTLIPMTTIPGLEVWCPSSSKNTEDSSQWVRPTKGNEEGEDEDEDDCTYVVALAGEFMQLLSDGAVPTCIHRVIPPQAPIQDSTGFTPEYIPRVSAPMFIRPRRGEEATLDVKSDLRKPLGYDNGGKWQEGMYFQQGLMEEINGMSIWKYMDCMSPNN